MPNTTSAKKRLRQSIVRRARNRSIKSVVRTHIRKVREAVQAGDVQKAEEVFRATAVRLDRAATKRVVHRNTVARTKSRLQKLIKSAKSASS